MFTVWFCTLYYSVAQISCHINFKTWSASCSIFHQLLINSKRHLCLVISSHVLVGIKVRLQSWEEAVKESWIWEPGSAIFWTLAKQWHLLLNLRFAANFAFPLFFHQSLQLVWRKMQPECVDLHVNGACRYHKAGVTQSWIWSGQFKLCCVVEVCHHSTHAKPGPLSIEESTVPFYRLKKRDEQAGIYFFQSSLCSFNFNFPALSVLNSPFRPDDNSIWRVGCFS